MATDRINFVDKDDARRILLGLLKHVTNAARTNTYKHFHKVRTGDCEERYVGFPRDRAREQGLTGTGRANKQHTLRDMPAQPLEFGRIAQEIDNLFQIILRFVDTGHILKRHPSMALRQQFRLGLAKAHGLAATALHLAHEENPHTDQKQHREPGDQNTDQRR